MRDKDGVPGRHSRCPVLGGADMRDFLVTTALERIGAPDARQRLPYPPCARVPGLAKPQVIP